MRRGLGLEDIMHKQFGGLMRQYEGYGKLNCAYWSYDASGEARTKTTASLLKSKGLNGGKGDYFFIKQQKALIIPGKNAIDHFIWLEFKKPKTTTAKGKQSDSQKEFESKFKDSINSRYYLVYSVQEAIKILEREGIL